MKFDGEWLAVKVEFWGINDITEFVLLLIGL